jgi:ubiquinone biosynthesis protein COQ9
LVEWHLEIQKNKLSGKAEELWKATEGSNAIPGVGGKVKRLTWERLMGNKEVIGRWQEALALLAQPTNIPLSLSTLAALSDELWFLAGDASVDTSWYTKRASLSSIYAASELFMTTDKSEGFKETREFLERRFEDSRALGSVVGGFGQWAGFQGRAAINVLRSKGVRI